MVCHREMAYYTTSWKLPFFLGLQKPEKFGDDKEVQVACIDFCHNCFMAKLFWGLSIYSQWDLSFYRIQFEMLTSLKFFIHREIEPQSGWLSVSFPHACSEWNQQYNILAHMWMLSLPHKYHNNPAQLTDHALICIQQAQV